MGQHQHSTNITSFPGHSNPLIACSIQKFSHVFDRGLIYWGNLVCLSSVYLTSQAPPYTDQNQKWEWPGNEANTNTCTYCLQSFAPHLLRQEVVRGKKPMPEVLT